ncbi:sorting nexin-20 [Centrocercus urophasianus]|uniref:sorting nexin-20 n=1 Tax=Centrocercus urophasianus TaxID=9002 RepID=UPI001C64F891|nr:sorting nexin-20 [Centrocercus urophasianus]
MDYAHTTAKTSSAFCSFAMEQDPECTAERELLEAASTIAMFSITAPPDEEQSQPKAEVSCELSKENPEKDKGSKDQDSKASLRPNSSMTTKELQEYWRNEKSQCRQVKLLFEIPSTRIVEHHLSKYVMYKIIILQTGSFDSSKSVIERRYSDFEKLHRNLLEDFSEEMEDMTFPKKALTGNFTDEIINERKLAFKDYLRLLYSVKCIRRSRKFIDFLTKPELQEAYGCLRGGQYNKALEILLEVIGLQERLTRGNPVATVPTLCAVVVCHKDLGNAASAFEYGEKALSHLCMRSSHKYYIPLLEAMITLAYELGKDFLSLQEKLEEWKAKKDPVRVFSLKELAVREYVK